MSTALIIFAKTPVAGTVKTRLIPALGADGAARLTERLIAHTLQQALALPIEHIELCVSPSTQHPAFERALETASGRLHMTLQGEGDLGQRMHRALSRVLSLHTRALLIGIDAPALNTKILAQAKHALEINPAVFVPTLDGGYALVGLTQPAPDIFFDMPWSTSLVMQNTRTRACAAGLSLKELPLVADIDEPADLVHLPQGWL